MTRGRLGFADTKGRGDFDQLAAFAIENGFQLIQISLDNPRYFPEKINEEKRRDVAKKLKDQDISLCFHGPSDLPLLNRHKKIRLAGVERLFEMIDMAIEMGAEYFILHPGRLAFYSSSTQKVFFMEQRFPDKFGEIFTESFTRILDYVAGRLILCVENTHIIGGPLLEIIVNLLHERQLFLVWDAAHVESLAEARRVQLLTFFQNNMRYVRLGHLHDIRDGRDHKGLGTGKLDVASYLEIFNTLSVDVVLEIFPEKELLKSMEYLRGLKLNAANM